VQAANFLKVKRMWVDVKSILGYTCTIYFGWIGMVNKNEVTVYIAWVAGITTIIYNGIRIYKETKNN
jgi:hypothetical protein